MGETEYNACLAAGGSPVTCQVHLEGDEPAGPTVGASAVGLNLFNTNGTFEGQLVEANGELFLRIGTAGAPSRQDRFVPFTGGNFLADAGLGDLFQLSINSAGGISKSAIGSLPTGGGGGGSAPAFSGTEAGIRLAAGLSAEESQANRDFQAEQNARTREANQRRDRLNNLTSLIERFVGAQQDATATLANLQPDAFAFAAGAQNLPVLGTTPTEGFRGALTEFKDRPTPSFDPEGSIESLDAAIAGLTGVEAPTAPPVGFEHGGFVPSGGSPNGGTRTARLIGEEGSVIAPGTEVMITSPEGVEILPLGRGFQEGGGVDFDTGTLAPSLSPLFESLGFDFIPKGRVAREPSGTLGFRASGIGGAEGLQRLGLRPTVIRRPGEGLFFREGQNLRPLSFEQFQEFGFRPRDVLSFGNDTSFETFLGNEGLSIGDPLTRAPRVNPSEVGPPQAFGPFTGIIREPTTGTILPAPFKVAAPLRRLASSNPALFELLLSAYDAAEFPRAAVISQIQAATPTGTARSAVGLR